MTQPFDLEHAHRNRSKAIAQRVCPLCGRTIGDRTRTKCPNFRKHVEACEKKRGR